MAGYKQGPGLSDATASVGSQVGLSSNQRVGNVAMGTTAGRSEFSGTAGGFGQEASAELTSSAGMGMIQSATGMGAQNRAKLDPSQEVSAFYEFSKEFGASRKNR